MFRRLASVAVFLVPIVTLWSGVSSSQVGLAPMVLELQEQRGQSQAVISVDNSTNQPFRARVYTQPFTYDAEQGFQALDSSPNDLSPYLQFSPRELVVPPGNSRLVRLLVRFPPNLPDGEYRTAIFTENLTETLVPDSQGNVTQLATRIGTTVFVRKGNVVPNLSAAEARFDPQRNEIKFGLQNVGQASSRPQTDWVLKQGETEIAKGKVPPTTVIAGSKRLLNLGYPGGNQAALPSGTYQLTGKLSWGGEEGNQNTLPLNLSFTVPSKALPPSP